MEVTKGFYDLCIPYRSCSSDINQLKSVIRECIELGYRTIAIEQKYEIHPKKNTNSKDKSKANTKCNDPIPPPLDLNIFSEYNNQIKILQRMTIEFHVTSNFVLNFPILKEYNLIAGLPRTKEALTHCCTTFNGDIISFNTDDDFSVGRKDYQMAVKRGMYFEIKYSHFILNSNLRKDIIKITHDYHAKGKSKNIIITSGAWDPFDLRGPYDVANLSLIFGLSEAQGKSSISINCRKLILRAESRRIGKTIMFVRKIGPVAFSDSDEEDNDGTKKKKGVVKVVEDEKGLEEEKMDEEVEEEGEEDKKMENRDHFESDIKTCNEDIGVLDQSIASNEVKQKDRKEMEGQNADEDEPQCKMQKLS